MYMYMCMCEYVCLSKIHAYRFMYITYVCRSMGTLTEEPVVHPTEGCTNSNTHLYNILHK